VTAAPPPKADYGFNWSAASRGVDGCFSGTSIVHLSTQNAKCIKEIKRGDTVLCNDSGAVSTVACVVILHVPTGRKPMVSFENGLSITPMHPILWDGEWALPGEIIPSEEVEIDKVYNLILEGTDTVVMNGITCSVMGTRVDHRRIAHRFWGNKAKVIECLKAVDDQGYNRGVVEIVGMVRDERGMVYGFKSYDGRELVGKV